MTVTGTAVDRIDFGYFVRPAEETGTGPPGSNRASGTPYGTTPGSCSSTPGWARHPEVDDCTTGRDADPSTRRCGRPVTASRRSPRSPTATCTSTTAAATRCSPDGRSSPSGWSSTRRASRRTTRCPSWSTRPASSGRSWTGPRRSCRGSRCIPTPGHTDGHQSLVVRHEDGSVLVVSGQSHDTSAGFAADALAVRARRDQHGSPLPVPPAWMDTILSWDPARVVFAHDSSVWEP